jgi:hypothetical protein
LKARVLELLNMVEEAAKADRDAGRLVWAQQQLELVKAVRQMLDKQKADANARWRKWYESKGKDAQQRRKVREALRETE